MYTGSSCNLSMLHQEDTNRYDSLIIRINTFINIEGFWFWLLDYILRVHLAALSSIFIMACLCFYINKDIDNPIIIIMYIIDLIYILRIILNFHLAYTNAYTGVVVYNARMIALRYLKTDFALDLISCIPIEVSFWLGNVSQYCKFLIFNRVCRFVLMFKYYNVCKKRLILSRHLRWSFLIYWTVFRLQLMANLW